MSLQVSTFLSISRALLLSSLVYRNVYILHSLKDCQIALCGYPAQNGCSDRGNIAGDEAQIARQAQHFLKRSADFAAAALCERCSADSAAGAALCEVGRAISCGRKGCQTCAKAAKSQLLRCDAAALAQLSLQMSFLEIPGQWQWPRGRTS